LPARKPMGQDPSERVRERARILARLGSRDPVALAGIVLAGYNPMLSLLGKSGRILPAHFFCSTGFRETECGQGWPGAGQVAGVFREVSTAAMSGQAAIERTVTGMGYDIVDIERSAGGLLRVTIDRLPGREYSTGPSEFVTVEDCELVTRQLQYVLEVEAVDYERLEVSSPGLDRPLKKADDYARFVGSEVELTLREAFQNRKRWRGVLQPREDGGWRLVLPPDVAPARAPGKGLPARRQPARAERAALAEAPAAPEQALDFALDEVREARLVPVVDFKGRRRAAGEALEKDGGQN
jgi:ribosome maturation factor RimP